MNVLMYEHKTDRVVGCLAEWKNEVMNGLMDE